MPLDTVESFKRILAITHNESVGNWRDEGMLPGEKYYACQLTADQANEIGHLCRAAISQGSPMTYNLDKGYTLVAPYKLIGPQGETISITSQDYVHDDEVHYFSDMGGYEPLPECPQCGQVYVDAGNTQAIRQQNKCLNCPWPYEDNDPSFS